LPLLPWRTSLTLRQEPTDVDQNAIAVVAAGGVIGYLPSKEAGRLVPMISDKMRARVTLDRPRRPGLG
jgi:hypothetical protein